MDGWMAERSNQVFVHSSSYHLGGRLGLWAPELIHFNQKTVFSIPDAARSCRPDVPAK